jgi:hypothetical protein
VSLRVIGLFRPSHTPSGTTGGWRSQTTCRDAGAAAQIALVLVVRTVIALFFYDASFTDLEPYRRPRRS